MVLNNPEGNFNQNQMDALLQEAGLTQDDFGPNKTETDSNAAKGYDSVDTSEVSIQQKELDELLEANTEPHNTEKE